MRSGAEGGGGHCVGAQGQRRVPDTPPDSARRDIATPLPFPCTPTPPCRCAAASSTTRSFFQPSSTPRTARCPRAARARRGMVRTAALTTPHTRRARGRPCRTLRIASSCRACVSVCFRVGVRETPGMAGIPWRFFADPAARDDRVGLGVVGWCPDRTANDNYAAPSLPCPRCLRLHGSVVARVLVLLHYYSMSNHFFMGRRESWIVISSACTATVPAEAEAMYYTL